MENKHSESEIKAAEKYAKDCLDASSQDCKENKEKMAFLAGIEYQKGKDKAIEIVKMLADWSNRYPRGRTYSFSQIKMDEELIAIEKIAKQFVKENYPEKLQTN